MSQKSGSGTASTQSAEAAEQQQSEKETFIYMFSAELGNIARSFREWQSTVPDEELNHGSAEIRQILLKCAGKRGKK